MNPSVFLLIVISKLFYVLKTCEFIVYYVSFIKFYIIFREWYWLFEIYVVIILNLIQESQEES